MNGFQIQEEAGKATLALDEKVAALVKEIKVNRVTNDNLRKRLSEELERTAESEQEKQSLLEQLVTVKQKV